MSHPGDPIEVETLLSHRSWIRSLARSLLRDASQVDDVEQETWLTALKHAPAEGPRIRGWLRRVVRSRAIDAQRADSRRVIREQRVARNKTAASVEDLASQVEMHRVVAEAVGELPMPYRAVVLLRYFDSLTPQEIAERFDVPAATIRTRLRRAHEMLRQRLAQAFDGDQTRMRGVLLLVASAPPIAVPGPVPGGGTAGGGVGGVAGMGAGKKVAAVALLVALGLMGVALLRQDADPRAEPDNADTPLLAEAPDPFGTPTPPALEGRDGAAGPLAEAEDLPREAAPGELLVRGRVVDASRRPVAGASVALVTTNKVTAVARSDMAGRFSFPAGLLPARWSGISFPLVRVQAGNGAYAYRGIQLTPDQPHVTDVGTLVLRMGFPLRVDVVGPGGPVAGARVAVMGVFLDKPGATHAYAFTQTDAAGRATFRGLPGKQLRVVVTATGWGRQVSAVVLPLAAKGRLLVELSSERILEVLVVDGGTGLPIAGAEVELWEEMRSTRFGPRGTAPFLPRLETPLTDENGRTHIRGLGRNGRLAVVARADGYPLASDLPDRGRNPWLMPDVDEVRLSLSRGHRVLWPLTEGEVPLPAEGTVIRLIPLAHGPLPALPASGVVRAGRLLVEGLDPTQRVHAFGVAPDGALALLRAGQGAELGAETFFRKARGIDVFVRDAEGLPYAGLWCSAQSSNALVLSAFVQTDEEGHARIEGLHGGAVTVRVGERPERAATACGSAAATVEAGDARVEITVARTRQVKLRILLDGTPGLPAAYTVCTRSANRLVPLSDDKVGEDLESATLDLVVRPSPTGPAMTLEVRARGYAPALVEVPAAGTLPVDLRSIPTWTVQILAPAQGRLALALEEERRGAWSPLSHHYTPYGPRLPLLPAADGHLRLDTLPPGRYRLTDRVTGRRGEPVVIAAGGAALDTVFDLRGQAQVSGRVELPAGYDPRWTRIERLQGPPPEGKPPRVAGADPRSVRRLEREGIRVKHDGTFQFRVPAGAASLLRAWHPVLVPALDAQGTAGTDIAETGIVVTGGREDVRLRLVDRGTATIHVDKRLGPAPLHDQEGSVRVCLYAGKVQGTPAHSRVGIFNETSVRFGRVPTGTWTAWIDTAPYRPLLLRNVSLGDKPRDLGAHILEEGSIVTVRILTGDGAATEGLMVYVTSLAAPHYGRSGYARPGETSARVSGLGPGRFRVHCELGLDEVIELDGSEPLELTLDLRQPPR